MAQVNQHKLYIYIYIYIFHGSNMTWICIGLQRQRGNTSTQRIWRQPHAIPIHDNNIVCGSQDVAREQGYRSKAPSKRG